MSKIKAFVKSALCMVIAFISAYLYPIACSADFNCTNSNYLGVYDNIYNQLSFINITSSEVNAIIVYSPSERKYISAVHGTGYINNSTFYADFDSYVIKTSSGGTVGVVNSPTILQGTVTYHSSSNIDIDIGSYTYNK